MISLIEKTPDRLTKKEPPADANGDRVDARGKTVGRYYWMFAFALNALAAGAGSPGGAAPAHRVDGPTPRPPPIVTVDESQEQKDIAFIANWVEHSAKDTHPVVLAGKFAKRLGLNSGQDIEGNGVSYYAQGSDKEYFFILLPAAKIVLAFKGSDFIVYWLINNGTLDSTAYEDSRKDLIVPNETYRDPYEKLIGMFLDRAKQETSGAGSSSQAPKQ